MGDGYTSAEQNKFISEARSLANYMFSIEPWNYYKSHFNVFAIKVISNQSGITHPRSSTDCPALIAMPIITADPYFGTTFDFAGIHRLVVPTNSLKIGQTLALNFPLYDQVMIVANSSYYGGSGGLYATSTTNVSAKEITAHELGHSFAGLNDEYYAGDQYARENINMTKETNPALVRWKKWLQHKGVGIHQHCCTGQSAAWFRPHQNCKMNVLNQPFCSVCVEAFIEKIHTVNPIVSIKPSNKDIIKGLNITLKLDTLMKPNPNTLKIEWSIDNKPVKYNIDSLVISNNSLSAGSHFVTATVIDTTLLVRADNHTSSHLYFVEWQIIKLATATSLEPNIGSIGFKLYPNPSQDRITLEIENESSSKYRYEIYNTNGALVKSKSFEDDKVSIDISNLPFANYILKLNINDRFTISKPFIKSNE
jgi:hypothetical protein